MKRKLLALGLVSLCAATLTACNKPEEPVGPVEGGIIKTPTTIHVWTTAGDTGQTLLNKWVEEFKEVEPNVTVENLKQSGSYSDLENAIRTGFTAGNYPDLAYCYEDHVANYIDYGKAVNLEPYITNETYGLGDQADDYIKSYMDAGKGYIMEGTYSVPFSKSTEAMFYNEDILLGLDLSSIDPEINGGNPLSDEYLQAITWEEMFEHLAPALLKYDTEVKDIIQPCDDGVTRVFGYDSDDNLFITLARQYGYGYTSVQNGKGVVEFNNDGMKNLLTKWSEYYDAGYLTTKGTNSGKYVNELFNKNQLLFSCGSTGGITYQWSSQNPMNIGVAKIPQAEGGTPSTILQGPSMTVLDHDDENRALAAWLFYKFITEESRTLEWALGSTGYYPIRTSNLSNPAYLDAADDTTKQPQSRERMIAKSLQYYSTMTDTLFTSPAFKGSSTCRTQVGGLVTQVLLDPSNVDGLFEEAENIAKLAL